MKKECKYFIIILFLLYFNYSCSQKQNEIKSIVVDQFGYRYYLSEGRGTVYKIRISNTMGKIWGISNKKFPRIKNDDTNPTERLKNNVWIIFKIFIR